jgi:hypothetical protein
MFHYEKCNYLPLAAKLSSDNRWIILAWQIPWDDIEKTYGRQFCDDNGSSAKSARSPWAY